MDGAKPAAGIAMAAALEKRLTTGREGRVALALLAAVRHVHDVLEDLRPSPREWRDVIDFLTEVGHSSDARRQEWVLFSDVIGASMLVEDLHSFRPAGATPNTLAGPFYRADVPMVENGANLSRDGRGQPLLVSGLVCDLAQMPVAQAVVEVWHASADGTYENQQPDLQPEFNLRGRLHTDAAGRFWFRSVCPGGYALPGDGPVGRLMQRLGIRLERPAHLHFRVSAPGHQVLTTHIYNRADPAIDRDALFCVKPDLLGDFRAIALDGSPACALDIRLVLAPQPAPSLSPSPSPSPSHRKT